MNSNENLAELLDKMINGTLPESIQAGYAIRDFGKEAVEPLVELLAHPQNYDSWWLIADALGFIGDNRAVEPLIEMLKSSLSYEVLLARKYTAWALGHLKDPRAVDVLLEMLQERIAEEAEDGSTCEDYDFETIEATIWALTEIDDPRTIEPIIRRILDDFYMEGSILTQWGEPALKFLLDRLNDEDEKIRSDAASLLGEFGDVAAVEPLIDVLKNDDKDKVRHSAAYALGELQDPRAYDVLLAALSDPYEQTRAFAAIGLGKLKEKRAINALKKMTSDEHPFVRKSANWALKWIGDTSSE